MINGPIIIVEDDKDDQDLYSDCIKSMEITNAIIFFDGAQPAIDYLLTTKDQPFIIFSDVNLPGMTGLEFKKYIQVDPYLSAKGIPFVLISTNAGKTWVSQAHALSVQGYFEKPYKFDDVKEMFRKIFDYWALCKHINNTK
jgi:CheY-like chemotaxis protein